MIGEILFYSGVFYCLFYIFCQFRQIVKLKKIIKKCKEGKCAFYEVVVYFKGLNNDFFNETFSYLFFYIFAFLIGAYFWVKICNTFFDGSSFCGFIFMFVQGVLSLFYLCLIYVYLDIKKSRIENIFEEFKKEYNKKRGFYHE